MSTLRIRTNKSVRTYAVLMLLISGATLPLFIQGLMASQRLKDNGLTTTGEVIELKRKGSSADDPFTYAPVVSFRDQTGVAHEFTSSVSQSNSPYRVGQNVTVVYDPQDTNNAEIQGLASSTWLPLMVIVFAGLMSMLAIAMIIKPASFGGGLLTQSQVSELTEKNRAEGRQVIDVSDVLKQVSPEQGQEFMDRLRTMKGPEAIAYIEQTREWLKNRNSAV